MKNSIAILFAFIAGTCFGQTDKTDVLRLADDFFGALERQDTAAIRKMFIKEGRFYSTAGTGDSARSGFVRVAALNFNTGQVIRERMRKTGVITELHGTIATIWAPYDLYINEKFSHCGVDVFNLFKTKAGWRIASITYTIEKKCSW